MNASPAVGLGTPANKFLGTYTPPTKEGLLPGISNSLYPGSQMTPELAAGETFASLTSSHTRASAWAVPKSSPIAL